MSRNLAKKTIKKKAKLNPVNILFSQSAKLLVYIINNPGLDATEISKKSKIPQATVYRNLHSLVDAGLLNFIQTKKKRYGGKLSLYTSKKKQFHIIINDKGIRPL